VGLTVDQLAFLQSSEARELLALDLPDDDIGAQTRLRKHCSPDQARAIVTIREIRKRAETSGRFPPGWARDLLATGKLLQQASSMRLATYVGRTLADLAGDAPVVDLCCGLGADSFGLALAGATVTGVDLSPEAILCAEHNAHVAGVAEQCTFTQADATTFPIQDDAIVHIDPDRRAAGRRAVAMSDYAPDETFLRELTARTRAGAMKLSPATPQDNLLDWPGASIEHISEGGTCRQCLLRWGADAGVRRATIVAGDLLDPIATSIDAADDFAPIASPGEFLIEPDAAVLAAEATDALAIEHDLWRIDPDLGWLFADHAIHTPLARCFRILHEVPGRVKDIRRAIADIDGGIVEVKPRNLRLDTDAMQRTLRGKGTRPLAILWTRLGERQVAFIAERM
jgi:SAM-dependent methyltransferase